MTARGTPRDHHKKFGAQHLNFVVRRQTLEVAVQGGEAGAWSLDLIMKSVSGLPEHAPTGILREFTAVSPREHKVEHGTVTTLSRSPLVGLGDDIFFPSPCSGGPMSFFRSPGSVSSLDFASPARLPSLGRMGGGSAGELHLYCSPQHYSASDADKQGRIELPPLQEGYIKQGQLQSASSLGLKAPGATREGTQNFIGQLKMAMGQARATPSLCLEPKRGARLSMSMIFVIETACPYLDGSDAPAMRVRPLGLSEIFVVEVDPITVCRDDEARACDIPPFSTSASTGRGDDGDHATLLPPGRLIDSPNEDGQEGKHVDEEQPDRLQVQTFNTKGTRLTLYQNLNAALDEALASDLAVVIGDEVGYPPTFRTSPLHCQWRLEKSS